MSNPNDKFLPSGLGTTLGIVAGMLVGMVIGLFAGNVALWFLICLAICGTIGLAYDRSKWNRW